jgi:hypothetical protein
MGMQRMQLDELESMQRGVQTTSAFARGRIYGGAQQPQFQEHRAPPIQTVRGGVAADAGFAGQGPERAAGQPQQDDDGVAQFGYPNYGQLKLSIRDFDCRETYKGLGARFEQWGLMFIGQVGMAECACGFRWPEEVKLNKLAQHLTGKAGRFLGSKPARGGRFVRSWSTPSSR